MEKEELIPTQQVGQQTDACKEEVFSSPDQAVTAYNYAKICLLNVNQWHEISSIEASRFALFDKKGDPLFRPAQESDYIRIDIPGPGTEEGKGYDWVCIEHLESFSSRDSDVDFTLFVARPCAVPGSGGIDIAHFFTGQATSTFLVFRRSNVLSAEVHGRNEVANIAGKNLADKARNLMVNGGSTIGMSYAQWHLLVSGIITEAKESS